MTPPFRPSMDSWLEDIYIVCSYWEEVTEFNNRKYIKKKACISSQRTIIHKTGMAKGKSEKKIRGLNTSWKWILYFLRLSEAYQRRLKRCGEAVGEVVIPGAFKRSCKKRIYDYRVLVSLTHCSQVFTLQSTGDVLSPHVAVGEAVIPGDSLFSSVYSSIDGWCLIAPCKVI